MTSNKFLIKITIGIQVPNNMPVKKKRKFPYLLTCFSSILLSFNLKYSYYDIFIKGLAWSVDVGSTFYAWQK